MKKIFLLLSVVLFVSMTFQSCNDDLTPEEAKAEISDADQNLTALLTSIKEGEAVTTLEKFFDFSKKKIAHDKGTENWIDDMFEELDLVIDFDQLDEEFENDGRFYFNNYKGKYTWNQAENKWEKSSSDSIIFEFPSEENMTTNDIVMSFYSYSDAQGTINGETMWIPTSFHADVKKDGTKLIGFDLNEIAFDSNLFYFYTKIDASLYLNPVTVSYLYDNKTPTNYYTSFNMNDGTNTLGYTASLNTFTQYNENFTEQDLDDISGDVTINNLVFKYNSNLEHIADYTEEPTETQINEDTNVDVYVDDFKIGFLLINNNIVYIEYNDGSREKFEDAFDGLIQELTNLENEYGVTKKKSYKTQKHKLIKYFLFKTNGYKNIKHFVKSEYKALSK